MQNEIKSFSESIKAEFQSQLTKLNDKIDTNQANVQQINELKSNFEQGLEQTNGADDDLKRISKLNELKINGIAHASDQNLNQIFSEMAKFVQFDLSIANNVPTLTRIFKRDHKSKSNVPTPIVIVKFVANHIRNDFYSIIRIKLQLTNQSCPKILV